MGGMAAAVFGNKLTECVCVLAKASARGPGNVLPDDGVADEAEVGKAPPEWSSAIN